jgi:cell wall-associated NlpC family hydrolase
MTTRADIVAAARGWLGTPWRHQERGPHFIDCAGLLERVGNDCGLITYIGPRDYRRESNGLEFLRHFARAGCREKSFLLAQDGDILIFQVQSGALPRHCGIKSTLKGRPHFIHSYAHPKWEKVIEDPLEGQWAPPPGGKLCACWQFPNIEEG